jgi:hypothetical protein
MPAPKPKRMGTPTNPDAESAKDLLLWMRENGFVAQAITVSTSGIEIAGVVDNRGTSERIKAGQQGTEEERKGIYEQFGAALIGRSGPMPPPGGESELSEPTEEDDDE